MVLQVKGLKRVLDQQGLLFNVSFELQPGEILFVRGPSGCGKTLLLRSLACLDQAQGGELRLEGKQPSDMGYPLWRAAVMYIPQARVTLPGTPSDFYFAAQQLRSQRGRPRADLPSLVHDMGLEQGVLHQPWAELSGGQAQRVLLAVAAALSPSVLLLDEPTSSCDPVSVRRVERALAGCGAAAVWVTHDAEQPARVGGRLMELPTGHIFVLPSPTPAPPPPLPMAPLLMPGDDAGPALNESSMSQASAVGPPVLMPPMHQHGHAH